MRIIFAALIAVFLTGCMSMPISTMVKMATFSPYDIDSQALRIAVRTDKQIQMSRGAVNMTMSYETEGGNGLQPVSMKHKFALVAQPDIKLDYDEDLRDGIEDFESLTIFRLSEEDAKKYDAILATAKKYKDADVKGTGGFGIGFENKCFGNLSQREELLIDIFLKTNSAEGYMLFLEDMDVLEEARDRDLDLKKINKC